MLLTISMETQISVGGNLGFSGQTHFITHTSGELNKRLQVSSWAQYTRHLTFQVPPHFAAPLIEIISLSSVGPTLAALASRDGKTDLVKKDMKVIAKRHNSTGLAHTAFVLLGNILDYMPWCFICQKGKIALQRGSGDQKGANLCRILSFAMWMCIRMYVYMQDSFLQLL